MTKLLFKVIFKQYHMLYIYEYTCNFSPIYAYIFLGANMHTRLSNVDLKHNGSPTIYKLLCLTYNIPMYFHHFITTYTILVNWLVGVTTLPEGRIPTNRHDPMNDR